MAADQSLAGWNDFALMLGGACAVLAGLIFLALSINIDRILRVRGLSGRAGESVILFLNAVCLSGFVLIPQQSRAALGIELLIAGVVTVGVLNTMAIRALRIPTRQPRSWRLFRIATVQSAGLPVIVAGTSLLGWPSGGLYWYAGAVILAVIAGTSNAWVLLVEVVRDQRYSPIDEGTSSENQ